MTGNFCYSRLKGFAGRLLQFAMAAAMAFSLASCDWFAEEEEKPDWEGMVTAVKLDKSDVKVEGGSSDYIALTITPQEVVTKVTPVWTWSKGEDGEELFSVDGNFSGCVVTGKKAGKGYLKCTLNNIVATCLVEVLSDDVEIVPVNYYIYSDIGATELTPGMNTNVSVSLYNGTMEDYEGFEWMVSDDTVAQITFARNNCNIAAKKVGSARVVASHPKAEYPFTFMVLVYPDLTKGVPFIRASSNVVAINRNSGDTKTVTFELVNDTSNGLSDTSWSYEDTTHEGPGTVVSITNTNSATLQITALRTGQAEITVRNGCCDYDLKLVVVVTEDEESIYITMSESTLHISDGEVHTIYAYLNGLDGPADNSRFKWSVEPVEAATPGWSGSLEEFMDFSFGDNAAQISGKKNGVFRVKVGHSDSPSDKTAVVILTNQRGSAVDADMYITTSQNYVHTRVNDGETALGVTLIGGEIGDGNGFIWEASSDDGDPMEILDYVCIDSGTVRSRTVEEGTHAEGMLYITPNKATDERPTGIGGTVRITVSHPKSVHTLEIIVRVYALDEVIEIPEPSYLTTSRNAVRLERPGDETTLSVTGVNIQDYDMLNNTTWEALDPEIIEVIPNGRTATVRALREGRTKISVDNTRSENILPIDVTVGADAEIYITTSQNFVRTMVGGGDFEVKVTLEGGDVGDEAGFEWVASSDDGDPLEMLGIESIGSGVVRRKAAAGKAAGTIRITPNKPTAARPGGIAGDVRIRVSHPKTEHTAEILVRIAPSVDTEVYITTSQNYVPLYANGSDVEVKVTLEGGSPGDEANFVWEASSDDGDPMEIIAIESIGSGLVRRRAAAGKAVGTIRITPNKTTDERPNGTAGDVKLRVSHPKAAYPVEIMVRVRTTRGYLTTARNLVNIKSPNETADVSVTGVDISAFAMQNSTQWTVEDPAIAEVSANGRTATVKALKEGKTRIAVENPYSENALSIDVVVGASDEAYITTSQNFVRTVVGGSDAEVRVKLEGGDVGDEADFVWEASSDDGDPLEMIGIVSLGSGTVKARSAATEATGAIRITPNKPTSAHPDGIAGDVKIRVSHPKTEHTVEILVRIMDRDAVVKPKYLTTGMNVVNLPEAGATASVSVTGVNIDQAAMQTKTLWSVLDGSVAEVVPNGRTATVRALREGSTIVTVSNEESENALELNIRVGARYIEAAAEPVVTLHITNKGGVELSMIDLLYGEGGMMLKGKLINSADTNGIRWATTDGSKATAEPDSGDYTLVTANASKSTPAGTSYVTATHAKAEPGMKRVLIRSAATIEDIRRLKGVYADVTYYKVSEDAESPMHTAKITLNTFGLDRGEGGNIKVKSNSNHTCTVVLDEIEDATRPVTATITGIKAGKTTIEAWWTDGASECAHAVIDVAVLPTEPTGYLTTSTNAIRLLEPGRTADVSVTGVNISAFAMQNSTEWAAEDAGIVEIAANGQRATVKALAEGKTKISIRNPYSENSLSMDVTVGASGEIYITTSQNFVRTVVGGGDTEVRVKLEGGDVGDEADFEWEASSESGDPLEMLGIVSVGSGTVKPRSLFGRLKQRSAAAGATGTIRITPNRASAAHPDGIPGDVKIRVSHPKTEHTVEILVRIMDRNELLKPKYLTTSMNAVNLAQAGATANVSVTGVNIDPSDMQNLTRWTLRDPSLARLESNGPSATLTALKEGSTTLVASNDASMNSVTIGVRIGARYIQADPTVTLLVTNSSGVEVSMIDLLYGEPGTMLKGRLVNSADANNIRWEETDTAKATVQPATGDYTLVTANASKSTPKGTSYVTATHSQAEPETKRILVRSAATVEELMTLKGVYTDVSYHRLSTDASSPNHTARITLKTFGLSAGDEKNIRIRSSDIGVCSVVMDPIADITKSVTATITGNKPGTARIEAWWAEGSSECAHALIDVAVTSPIDTDIYITTSQNYVQTKVNGTDCEVRVTLVGGEAGDEANFVWEASSGDGKPLEMLDIKSIGSGTVRARSASAGATGTIRITPNKTSAARPEGITGDVRIAVSHPKCPGRTAEILVRIFSQYALIGDSVTLSVTNENGSEVSVIDLLYGESGRTLRGRLRNSADTAGIRWATDPANNTKVTVQPDSGDYTVATPNESKSTPKGTSFIVATHSQAEPKSKRVLVRSAATMEELLTLKGVYADVSYYRVSEDAESAAHTATVSVNGFGLTSGDKANIRFKSNNSQVCSVVMNPISDITKPITATITGNRAGSTTIEAWWTDGVDESAHAVIDVVVYTKRDGDAGGGSPTGGYITTRDNFIRLSGPGESATIGIEGVGIPETEMSTKTAWTVAPQGIVSMAANGASATVTAVKEGSAVITVRNSSERNTAKNSLSITVRVGSQYVEPSASEPAWISTDSETYSMRTGDTLTIGATLENRAYSDKGWTWSVPSGSDKVSIASSSTSAGTTSSCVVEAKKAGTAIVRIQHGDSKVPDKEVIVVVGNGTVRFITTTQNVVTVRKGETAGLNVGVFNGEGITSGFKWTTGTDGAVELKGTNGPVAAITGLKPGMQEITVENTAMSGIIPLKIIAVCVDPTLSVNPYITAKSVVTITEGESADIEADISGADPSYYTGLSWTASGASGKLEVSSGGNACHVKALDGSAGTYQLVISHKNKEIAPKTVLVVVNKKVEYSFTLTTSDKIIQRVPADYGPLMLTVELYSDDRQPTPADYKNITWGVEKQSSANVVTIEATYKNCIVTPVNIGTAQIRAQYRDSIVLFTIEVTSSTKFAFSLASGYVTVEEGDTTVIPLAGTEGGSSVTVQSSGSGGVSATPSLIAVTVTGESAGQSTLTATLKRDGSEIGSDQIIVNIVKKAESTKYIKLNTPSLITVGQGTKNVSLSATAFTDNRKDDGAKLEWKSDNEAKLKKKFDSDSGDGASAAFDADGTGMVKVTVSAAGYTSAEAYIYIVPAEEKMVYLSRDDVTVYEYGGNAKIMAEVANGTQADYAELKWKLLDESGRDVTDLSDGYVATLNGSKGKTATLTAGKAGKVTLVAELGDTGKKAQCTVNVKKTPKIEIVDRRSQYTLPPGSSYLLDYTITPGTDTLRVAQVSDASLIGATPKSETPGDKDKPAKGTVLVTGKKDGFATVELITVGGATLTVNFDIGKNYKLSWRNQIATATPKSVIDDGNASKNPNTAWPLEFEYTLRPSNAFLGLMWSIEDGDIGIQIPEGWGSMSKIDSSDERKNMEWALDQRYAVYTVKPNQTVNMETGEVTGKIRFYTRDARQLSQNVNFKVFDGGTSGGPVSFTGSSGKLSVRAYYSTLHPMVDTGQNKIVIIGRHSRYDPDMNAIVIGDGEEFSWEMKTEEEVALDVRGIPDEDKIKFVPANDTGIKNSVNFNKADDPQCSRVHARWKDGKYQLGHEIDYGWAVQKGELWHGSNFFGDTAWPVEPAEDYNPDSIAGLTETERRSKTMQKKMTNDDTVVYSAFVGTVLIRYRDFATDGVAEHGIKVFVEARNSCSR